MSFAGNIQGEALWQSSSMESGALGTIDKWCEALPSVTDTHGALSALASCLNAEVVVLSRTPIDGGKAKVVAYDPQRAKDGPQSAARCVLGSWLGKARPGASWVKSTMDCPQEPELSACLARRGLAEVVVIPLNSMPGTQDALEVCFRTPVRPYRQALLKLLAQALARSWSADAARRFFDGPPEREVIAEVAREVPILGMDNPAGLSRSEYRICLLLGSGKQVKGAQSDLGISDSTMRTHLRNIYAKTETQNLNGLLAALSGAERMGARA